MKVAKLPIESPLHGAFGQGRSDPDCMTLFRGWTRLTTDPRGDMESRPLEGFFYAGTQLVTHYQIRVNGHKLVRTFAIQSAANQWSSVFLVPGTMEQGNLPAGRIPEGSVELRILRSVDRGWLESIRLFNYGSDKRKLLLEIELGCPIGDVEFEEEMKEEDKARSEGILPEIEWENGFPKLHYMREFGLRKRAPTEELKRLYGERAPVDGQEVARGVDVRFRTMQDASSNVRFDVKPGKITCIAMVVTLSRHGYVDLCTDFSPHVDGRTFEHSITGAPLIEPIPKEKPELSDRTTIIRTGNSTLNMILAQAQADMESLALPTFGTQHDDDERMGGFNAGVPRYIGIFCRDTLTTAWQSALFSPRFMESALSRVGVFRGVKWDSWRDEEPDRIPHERRLNPKAALGDSNRELYYGDVPSTPFWIVTLAATYNWTGDRDLLHKHKDTLEACCRWMERKLQEGNGFVYYAPALPDNDQLNRHHAWKDSGDAIVDGRGRVCVPPLATVEIQAYCFGAFLSAAGLALAMGKVNRAREFYDQAIQLKKRFNDVFWMPERRFFAMALDGDGRPVDAIGSNIGHCLCTGIIDEDKTADVVRGLVRPEMFSGWGIRTLSSDNPAYDPFSYHRGSVWPVENSTIAWGLAGCGYLKEAHELIGAQLGLATLFPNMRLPEVFSGHERSENYPAPGLYPQANLLQAWSVSAISLYLQILVGIRAFAPIKTLLVKPILPEWLPWVELRGLRVGKATVDLRFWRDDQGRSHWKVLSKRGFLVVLEQPTELSPEATLARRISEAASSVGYFKLGLWTVILGTTAWLGRDLLRKSNRIPPRKAA